MLIGIALIALPFVINVENGLWFWIAGFVIFILGFWLWRRKRKKQIYGGSWRRPGLGDAREMPALTPGRVRAIEAKRAREREKLKRAEVMEMRAVNPKDLRRGAV